jgi:hypothetical protein
MAVRFRFTQVVQFGHYREFYALYETMEQVVRDRGWRPGSLWMPVAGKTNEVVYECDYADLAEFERETDASQADPEFMKLFREMGTHVVQGSAFSEVLIGAGEVA